MKVKYKIPKMTLTLVVREPRGPKAEPFKVTTPLDVEKLLDDLKKSSEEHFVSLHLNSRHEVIGLHEVSHGTLSSSLVHPREVFKAALLANSYALIVCHNHPSGSRLFASGEDLDTTKVLINSAKILGVSLLDHIIVGPGQQCFSIKEHHPEYWD